MAFRHGRTAHITIQDSGGVARVISVYADTSGIKRMIETAEVTVYADNQKKYIVGLTDATFSMGGPWDLLLDGYLTGIIQYDPSRNIVYGPESNTTGRVRYTFATIMTAYDVSSPVGDRVAWTGEFQVTGAITVDTYP